jgi:ATP-dependent DNA ligase
MSICRLQGRASVAWRRYELQAEVEDRAKFVVTATASAYLLRTMKINPLPAGFVVPAQRVKASKPPVGTDWVHEIKHDGYRIIVGRILKGTRQDMATGAHSANSAG